MARPPDTVAALFFQPARKQRGYYQQHIVSFIPPTLKRTKVQQIMSCSYIEEQHVDFLPRTSCRGARLERAKNLTTLFALLITTDLRREQ